MSNKFRQNKIAIEHEEVEPLSKEEFLERLVIYKERKESKDNISPLKNEE